MVGEKKITLFSIINTIILSLAAVAILYPVIQIIAISFSEPSAVVQGRVYLWPIGFNFDAYVQIANDPRIPRSYLNTILYTSVGTFINLAMTAVAAYPLSRRHLFGRKLWIILIVLTMFINGGMIPTYLVVREVGLLNSMWALVIPNAIWTFELLIMKSFFENMSESLRESAVIDGASEYRILYSIMIPLAKPALASIGLFYFMGHWNSWFLPSIYLGDTKMYPVQVVLRDLLIQTSLSETVGAEGTAKVPPEAMKNAIIFATMIPVLIVYPLAQKYFAKGVMLGAEKG